jgi:hypothetical protein
MSRAPSTRSSLPSSMSMTCWSPCWSLLPTTPAKCERQQHRVSKDKKQTSRVQCGARQWQISKLSGTVLYFMHVCIVVVCSFRLSQPLAQPTHGLKQ